MEEKTILWVEGVDYMDFKNRISSERINTLEDLRKFLQYCEDKGYKLELNNLYLCGFKPMTLDEILRIEKEGYEKRVQWAKERYERSLKTASTDLVSP